MRLLLASLLICGVLLGGLSAVAGDAPLSVLTQWVGKYPNDKIDDKTIWDHKGLKELARGLLQDRTLNDLYDEIGRQIAAPIEIKDDILMIFVCREHACMMNSATMFADLKKNKLHICWRNVYDKQDAWLSTDKDPVLMDIGACNKFEGFDLYKNYVNE